MMIIYKDTVSAVLSLMLGVIVLLNSRHLEIGTLSDLGLGFVPTMLGILLCVFGVLLIIKPGNEILDLPKFNFRAISILLASFVLFSNIIESTGLLITVLLVSVTTRLMYQGLTMSNTIILSILNTALVVILFHYILELHITLYPKWTFLTIL